MEAAIAEAPRVYDTHDSSSSADSGLGLRTRRRALRCALPQPAQNKRRDSLRQSASHSPPFGLGEVTRYNARP